MAEVRNPRVLIAIEQLRRAVPGGIGSYARGLLTGLAESAHGDELDVTLLASRGPGVLRHPTPASDPLARMGRPLVTSRLPGPLLTRAWDHGWLHAPGGFDIVHSISLTAPPNRATRAQAVVTVHDLAWRRHPESATPRGRRWHEAALSRTIDSGARLITSSQFVAADLRGAGVEGDRITVVPGGSDHLVPEDPVQTGSLLEHMGIRGDFLLTVSTLEPRKNIERLLRAYSMARHALHEPWPLLIVGPTGWGQVITDSEEHSGVVFAGAVPDAILSGLYRRARAFVYVPLTEGYGLPPLEAMRFGAPSVVATEVPSVNEHRQPGPSPAVLVDPTDVDAIAAGLVAVLSDEALRADLAVRGAAHAGSRTWRAAAQQHITLWRSLA